MLTKIEQINPDEPLIVYAPLLELHGEYAKALHKLFPDRRFGSGSSETMLDDNELIITEFPPPAGCAGQWMAIETLLGRQTPPKPKLHTDGLPLEPWIPMTDPVDKKVVGKTMEELFEFVAATAALGQAIARCFIQGIDEFEPTTGKSNRQWLTEEIADVTANLRLMRERFQLDSEEIEVRASMKWSRQRVWHDMPAQAREKVVPIRPRREQATESLIFDWGSKGDPSRRDTMTIPAMLRTLSDREVYEIADCDKPFYCAATGWVWHVPALKNALIDNGQMPERYRPIDTAQK